ncbi:hypothetical protein XENOCAPTIV_020620, partial [Xenoophorus captivus]
MNTPGSYKCYCLDGYALQPDGSCRSEKFVHISLFFLPLLQNFILIAGPQFKVSYLGVLLDVRTCYHANCQYGCEVMKGEVRCTCPSPGLRLGPDRRSCVDIDECALGGVMCPRHRKCFNTFGSFFCKCHLGFKLTYINGRYACIGEPEYKDTRPFCSLNASSPKCRCKDGSCKDQQIRSMMVPPLSLKDLKNLRLTPWYLWREVRFGSEYLGSPDTTTSGSLRSSWETQPRTLGTILVRDADIYQSRVSADEKICPHQVEFHSSAAPAVQQSK